MIPPKFMLEWLYQKIGVACKYKLSRVYDYSLIDGMSKVENVVKKVIQAVNPPSIFGLFYSIQKREAAEYERNKKA